jgi:signal transduction histidine kinase
VTVAEAGQPAGWMPGQWRIGRWWVRHGLGPVLLRWWRGRGLRSRVTITAALGLLVAFAAADLLLFNALRVSLTHSVDDYARSGATEVAALINARRLPDPVPVAAGTITIQVLDASGHITDVSPDADRLVPIISHRQAAALAGSGTAVLVRGGPFDMPSLLRVSAVRADGGQLVIAAVPFSEASGSLSVVARALLIGTPVLFLAFTWAIWIATGSTLRPIGALRRGAARVTETGVPSDLPVPEARDEVRLLALTLNDMLSRLAGAQQRQRALVSDTAHELRSPIASIRTQLEVALDFPDGQDWETTARDVHADVLRLARLAEDLLLLARLDERADAARHGRPVDLAELARSVVCRYADARVTVSVAVPGAAETGEVPVVSETPVASATLAASGTLPASGTPAASGEPVPSGTPAASGTPAPSATLPASATLPHSGTPAASATSAADVIPGAGDTPARRPALAADNRLVVSGDRERLDRLLVNLVDNAVRYAKTGVVVRVRRDGRWVELAVTDDGPGIQAADRERAFDRFARLDDARSRDGDEAGGAGLGLAIVRATAQAYGGTVSLTPASAPASPSASPPDPAPAVPGQPGTAEAGQGLRAVVQLPAADISFLHASNLGAACRTASAARSVTCGVITGLRSCGRSI